MQLLLETCPLFNSDTLSDFLIPLAWLYWQLLVIITSKSKTYFTKKLYILFATIPVNLRLYC